MVLRYILAVLCEMSSITPVMTDGYVEKDQLHGRHDHLTLNPLDFYVRGHLRTLVYAAPVDNEETFHHRIVDAC
jgi:hypothetical protein